MSINSTLQLDRFLKNSLQNLDTVTEDRDVYEKEVNTTLTTIADNLKYLQPNDDVCKLSTFLRKHASQLNDSDIIERYQKIIEKIFNLNEHGENYLHLLAIRGNFEALKALARLAPSRVEDTSKSGKTALEYAYEKSQRLARNKNITEYLNMFNNISLRTSSPHLISFDRLNDIRCKKGEASDGLHLNEHLILNLGKAGLKIIKKYAFDYRYEGVIRRVNYYFTQSFFYKHDDYGFDDRPIIFCFVEKKGKLYPRLFCLSNSQSVWRRVDKIFPNWIGKSARGEEALQVPLKINFELFKIYHEMRNEKSSIDLEFSLGKNLFTYIVDWSDESVSLEDPIKDFYKIPFEDDPDEGTDVAGISGLSKIKKQAYELCYYEDPYTNPKENEFTEDAFKPDFSNPEPQVLEFIESPFPQYKRLIPRTFLSNNKEIRYLFLEQKQKGGAVRVFLAAAEVVASKITKLGLRHKWAKLGGLSLPLYEYSNDQFSQGEFGDYWENSDKKAAALTKRTIYVSTWKYLKETPTIRSYLEALYPRRRKKSASSKKPKRQKKIQSE